METTFKVNRADINNVLLEFKRLQKKFYETGVAKIRVMPGGIEISGQGIYKTIHGETEGLSEVFVPLKLLYTYSSTCSTLIISFKFRDGEMQCGSSRYSLPKIKVETWFNSPDLELSINSDDFSILKEALLKGDEHMNKHNLGIRLREANAKLDISINGAFASLKGFKISKDELRNLVINKLIEK